VHGFVWSRKRRQWGVLKKLIDMSGYAEY
jgi:hypothetical protein